MRKMKLDADSMKEDLKEARQDIERLTQEMQVMEENYIQELKKEKEAYTQTLLESNHTSQEQTDPDILKLTSSMNDMTVKLLEMSRGDCTQSQREEIRVDNEL